MSIPRRERLSELFRSQLGNAFLTELDLPENTIISLTEVRVTEDLQDAIIGVSVLPESEAFAVLHALRGQANRLRGILRSRLRIRKIPKLKFYKDDRHSHAQHIEELLDELKSGERF